ncbi:GIY-YIG nuclease family protein [Tetragenococcus halophilus]|uniref:GIY-YIG nuclease family protein n=2 Tax=Tetragenococcus halophilus TaxID=51669 RepID=UPI00209469E8|nr:GIY-YIG nuclease family protein [Tetragenococcus halophilus]MCO7026140.1 GIY-YIG nuclease family protein [Tetragenococcus halophilus]
MKMKKSIKESHTLYAVKGYLPKRQESIQIGKLGHFAFEKGYYVYVGSAKRNISSRVNRHIAVEKKQRWHLDYLRPFLKIEEVQTYSGKDGECQLFAGLRERNNGSIPAKGFGSSDCKCVSHLFYTEKNPMLTFH